MIITLEQLVKIFPLTGTATLNLFLPFLNKYMPNYGILSAEAVRIFLAQVGHESGGFRYTEEIASGAAYDTGKKAMALGNTPEADGDGQRYKGRGLIQITGAANYACLSRDTYGTSHELLRDPSKLKEPDMATRSACWYWSRNGLTQWAEKPEGWVTNGLYMGIHMNKFQYITYRINGGLNGYQDRLNYYARAVQVIKP